MDKKFSIIAIVIAVILIVVGGYLILTNPYQSQPVEDSSDISLKTQNFNNKNFKLFEMNVPEGSNFTVENEVDGMKYYQNKGNYSKEFTGLIITKNMTDSMLGDNSEVLLNTSTEQIYSLSVKNQTETLYKIVSQKDGADFMLFGNDLNLLKELSNTIEVKDTKNL